MFNRDLLKEASGVLNRCLDGARRLIARGHFRVPSSIKGRQNEILREASTVAAFASECLVEAPGVQTPKQDIYSAFEKYCSEHGRNAAADNVFFRDLRSSGKFRDDMVMRTTIAGERAYVIKGLRIELDENSLPYDPSNEFD